MKSRKLLLCTVVFSFLIFGWIDMVEAKSVFAIASHGNSKIKAYYIHDPAEPNGVLEYQATIAETENFGNGAGGLCLWPVKDRMFVTYEGTTVISWASIKNLNRNPATDEYATGITGGNGLGGMAVDEGLSRLYVISRGTDRLFAYDYDEYDNTLIPIALDETNDYVILEDIGINGGIDIALDENNNLMFVSDLSPTVRYYNTSTWQIEGNITLDRSAIGIGLDKTQGYLYAGFFTGTGGQNYLMRYDLDGDPNDPETYLEKNLGAPVMDIAVDEDTGYIYLTLKRIEGNRYGVVEVYDPTNWISTNPDSLILMDSESDNDFVSQGPGGITIGPSYKPPNIFLSKTDNIDDPNYCAAPGDMITYTICFAPGADPNVYYDVVVTDRLPPGVDFIYADPNTGYYTQRPVHTYTWEIGFVPGYDPNSPTDPNQCLDLYVLVNEGAEPLGELVNIAEIESENSYTKTEVRTPVCCWDGERIIYVDQNAEGAKAGTSWENAYRDLQDALTRAAADCGSEIWVAQGIYSPGNDENDSFVIPDGVEIYGGFNGTETMRKQRDYVNNETILSGYIREDIDYGYIVRNNKVATMGDNTVLDGFLVEEGNDCGIYGFNDDFTVCNCVVRNNEVHGFLCQNGNINLQWCVFKENVQSGIHHIGNGATIKISNCKVYKNLREGIYCNQSIPTILNTMIYDNGSDGSNYYGIKLYYPSDHSFIRNNTIAFNNNAGIYFAGEKKPTISNCILWGNNEQDDLVQMVNCNATFSCIHSPDDPEGVTPPDPNESGNICTYPEFADPNNFDYHLGSDSPCIDLGDLEGDYEGEKDIDDQRRVLHGGYDIRVDIGADEYCGGTDTNYADFNDDGYVDLFDYAELANAWLTEPNDLNPIYDLNDDEIVSLIDLSLFTDEWLWMACWNYQSTMMMSQGGGGGFDEMSSQTQITTATMPPPVEITVELVLEVIDQLQELWETNEKFRQVVTDEAWKESMEFLYQELERLSSQSQEKE
jgi:uncharacterized repeat protein (TIGR01451 family)